MKYRKGEYILVANKLSMQELKPTTQCLWVWLCAYADGYGQCWPSRKLLAKNLHASVKTVDRQLKVLEKLGWIEKTTRYKGTKQQSNLYQLNLIFRGDNLSPLAKEGRQKSHLGGTKTTHRTKPRTNKKYIKQMKEKLRQDGIIT